MMKTDLNNLPYRPCVGIMLVNTQGKIFAGERLDTPGAWQMPQGGIDEGEEPEQAAYRELYEETGVEAGSVVLKATSPDWFKYDLPKSLRVKSWQGKYRGQKQKWFLMQFTKPDTDINIHQKPAEFSQWQWMSSPDILQSIIAFKRPLYQEVLTYFKDTLSELS